MRSIPVFPFIFLIILSACDGDIEEPLSRPAPLFISSDPADGESEVTENRTYIELIFNENVTLVASHRITLNGVKVTDVRPGKNRELKIMVSLEPGTKYSLLIPAETIKGPTGVFIPQEIRLSFTTHTPLPPRKGLSAQAEKLFQFLNDQNGKATIPGTMANVSWNINEAEWVHHHTGKWPALNCFDYIHLQSSPTNWIDYGDISVVENWWNNNGLVSIMWHWNVPANSGNEGAYSFYWGSKPEETLFDVKKIEDPTSKEYKRMIADIDKVAGYLKLLKDKQIPVIWRPLHEAAGNIGTYPGGTAWFWWGTGGTESFKSLWRLMFDRMTNLHGLNNLIWVWTSQLNDEDWYPGDNYVDIVGRDIYNIDDATDIKEEYTLLNSRYPEKLISLSECGNIAGITDQWKEGVKWLWFMPWYDYDRTLNINSEGFQLQSHQHANIDWWKDAFNNNFVLTRDKIPDLK